MNRQQIIQGFKRNMNVSEGYAKEFLDGIINMVKEEVVSINATAGVWTEPQLIQGYTAEQWQEIIDGGYLCEFSTTDNSGGFLIDLLADTETIIDGEVEKKFRSKRLYILADECRPAQIKGVMRPIFVEPVDKEVMCVFFDKDGYPLNERRNGSSYDRYKIGTKIFEYATKYIEV